MSKIGALWEKQSEYGTYYSGNIEVEGKKHQIFVSIVAEKTKETSPDLIIKLAEKKSVLDEKKAV